MTAAPASSRYRYVIGCLVFAIQLSVGFSWMGIAPLFPAIMDEFGVSRAVVSLLVAVLSLESATLNVPWSVLAARIGLRRALSLATVALCSGAATPLCGDFGTLLALRAVYGLGSGAIWALTSGAIMEWFPSHELPLWNGLSMAGNSLGIAIALLVTVPLSAFGGWRFPLTVYGWLGVAVAAAWALLGRSRASGVTAAPSVSLALTALRSRLTLYLALAMMGPFFLYMALSSWLPVYYYQAFGIELAAASAIVGLFNFVGAPASLVGGVLPLRLGRRRPIMLVCGVVLGVVGFGTFLVNNPLLIYGSIVIVGSAAWLYLPAAITSIMETPGMTSATTTVTMAAALSLATLSSFTAPIAVGFLADATGSYVVGFSVASVAAFSLVAASLLLPETGPGRRR